jgi:hypothetical protein
MPVGTRVRAGQDGRTAYLLLPAGWDFRVLREVNGRAVEVSVDEALRARLRQKAFPG